MPARGIRGRSLWRLIAITADGGAYCRSVLGPDPVEPTLYWIAGQGGYGIQVAPALAQLAASSIISSAADIPAAISTARLRDSQGSAP